MKNSPFSLFRKYQREGMVALTVMAMFSFVFLGTASNQGGGNARGGTDVAVKIRGGNISTADLSHMRYQRTRINEFIAKVVYEVSTADEEDKIPPQQINQLVYFNQFGVEWRQFPQDSDENLIWTHIMRLEARRLGLVVTEPMVTSHIERMTQKKLTPEQFRAALAAVDLREKDLYDIFREELLARNAYMITRPMIDHTPEQYWKYYREMKVRQNLEIAALPVSEFAKQVTDPGDSVLEPYFNEHKLKFPGQYPNFASPGFRQPTKVQVQYLTASYEEVEKTVPPITDKQVNDYYELKKDSLYREIEKPELGASDNDPLNPELAPEIPPPPALPESVDPSAPPPSKPAKEKTTEKPVEKPAENPAEKPADAPKEKPSEKPADKKPDEKPAEEGKTEMPCEDEPAAKKEAVDEKPAAEKPAETKSEVKKSATDKPAGEKPAEKPPEGGTTNGKPAGKPPEGGTTNGKPAEKPPEGGTTNGKPAAAKPAAGKPPEGGTTNGKTAAGKKTDDKQGDDKKTLEMPVKYQPLTEQLKDNIRDELLRQKTQEALKKIGSDVLQELDGRNLKYNMPIALEGNKAYIDFNEDGKLDTGEPSIETKSKFNPEEVDKIPADVSSALKQKVTDIAATDLQAVGKKFGMSFKSTGLVSAQEIDKMSGLGKVVEESENQFQSRGGQGILNVLFGKEILFNPELGRDSELGGQDIYVYWKTELIKSHVPKFKDPGIRDQVLAAWQTEQAYPLAVKRAEELAKQAKDQPKLAVAFKDQTVTPDKSSQALEVRETSDFSWRSPGVPSPGNFMDTPAPVLSKIDFVDDPSVEFMQAACKDLGIGQVGVAPNRDHTIVYVMRVINRDPKPGDETQRLRETFMKERLFAMNLGFVELSSSYSHIAAEDNSKLYFDWMEGLKAQYQISYADEEKVF